MTDTEELTAYMKERRELNGEPSNPKVFRPDDDDECININP